MRTAALTWARHRDRNGNVSESCALNMMLMVCLSRGAHMNTERNMLITRCLFSRGKYPGGSLAQVDRMCLDSRRAW